MSYTDRQQAETDFLRIKEEPFAGEYFPETVSQPETNFDEVRNELESCCLCPVGMRLQHLLAEHFQTFHSDICDGFIFTHVCNCGESILLQMQLINHLLSHIITKKKPAGTSNLQQLVKVESDALQEFESVNIADDPPPRKPSARETSKRRKPRTKRPAIANEFTFDDGAKKFSCNHCQKQFTCSSNVRKHLLQHDLTHQPKSERVKLKRPTVTEDKSDKEKCHLCPREFSTREGFESHWEGEHNPENPLKCEKCPVGFCKTLVSLQAHLRSHDPLREDDSHHQCKECLKVYTSAKQLYHHMLTHREKLLCCDKCGKKFNFKQKLREHLLTHAGIDGDLKKESTKAFKKTMCEHCSMMVGKDNMKRHILNRHSSDRPFKCDEPGCQSAFKDSRTLREHKNLHSGEKPFLCEFCDERFHHSATLRIHRLRHTNPDKFKCGICGECFVNNQSLMKHTTRQHPTDPVASEIRPFACDYDGCTSTFKYREFMMKHKRNVHNRKKVEMKCDLCNFTSDSLKNFNRHMRRAHDIRKRGRMSNRVFPSNA